jgi:fatty acid synthase subunit alpha
MSEMMIKNQLVKIKEHPPYLGDMEGKVLLNSMARATLDTKTGEYSFRGKLASEVPVDKANVKAVEEIFAANGLSETSPLGVGVDQGLSCQTYQNALH